MSQDQSTTVSCPQSPQHGTKSDKSTTNCQDGEKGWIYHRNRGQPMPDPNEPPLNRIKFYLDRYKIKEALQIFFSDNTLKLLHEDPDFLWDVIPIICRRLRGLCQYRFRVFEGCEKMLHRIAIDEKCNPKEVLISFLAEISCEVSDNIFRAMIRPLESTLLRMDSPTPRDENLRWVINVLMRHINSIGVPQEFSLDSKKRPDLRNDPSVLRYVEVLPLMLAFIESFNEQLIEVDSSSLPILTQSQLDGVLNGELVDDEPTMKQSSDTSITVLMNLMHKPFTFLDLTIESAGLKMLATRYLNTLLRLNPNVFAPIYKRIDESFTNTDSDSYSATNSGFSNETNISLATCSYIHRCERWPGFETMPSFPQVISNESALSCHLPFVIALLELSEMFAHEKGLILLDSLLKPLRIDSLDRKYLALFQASSLLKQLFQIIVFSSLATNRRKAYEAFTRICDLLTYDCKVELFTSILSQTEPRPCIRAACIDQYRKHLTISYRGLLNLSLKAIEPISPEESPSPQPVESLRRQYGSLIGQSLADFLDLCIKACLPDSQHTDIIENYELILATLTLLRFLKMRKQVLEDVDESYLSGKSLKKSFFEPIRSAIALITKDLKATQSVDKQEEADCLSWALCRIDLIDSVLIRTCDLYDC